MARVLVAFFAILFMPAKAEMRKWTSHTGSTMEAEYVRSVGGVVVLKKADGKTLSVRIEHLSKSDRER
jgi:hypothetical protein